MAETEDKKDRREEPSKPHIPWQDRPEIPQSEREKQGSKFPGEKDDNQN